MIKKSELVWAEKYFRAVNYIAATSVYLKDNFLLERPLEEKDIKDSLLGHWGTCPGINFIYTHLNLLVSKTKQEILLVNGPGHGFAAVLANLFMEGSLKEYYDQYGIDKKGLGNVIKAFCWPGGFPSHINPQVPGCIYEGGELGYSLSTAYGTVFDNPDLITTCIIGDGECETGPAATGWHSNKFLNPERDGAVLPIIHLNGFKIGNPTIYATMSDSDLKKLFEGYGYDVRFVEGNHVDMINSLEWAYKNIKDIQKKARSRKLKKNPRWPLLILKTEKGWTGPKTFEGHKIEGNWRSHQVPLPNVKSDRKELIALEKWFKSYKPDKLFPDGEISEDLRKFIPSDDLRIGMNKNANPIGILKPLKLPDAKKFSINIGKRGSKKSGGTPVLGKYLKNLFELNEKNKNFRLFSPDELGSNKLDAVLEATGKAYSWDLNKFDKKDSSLDEKGRVMEILSEHTLQGWMQGYILSGRHGIFSSYEAFLPIVDSMISQYLKFIEMAEETKWRADISSFNYLASSVCWRQDHNGFSHQNPGFINNLLNKATEEKHVRLYFPADVNSLLAITDTVLQSKNKVNAIITDKRPIKQWLNYSEAIKQRQVGAAIWDFASDKNPDIIFAACGDYQTQEMLAAIKLLRSIDKKIKVRFVNVSELGVLGVEGKYPNALSKEKFEELFTKDKHVIFNFHGYPSTIKQLLFDRPNTLRFHIRGYIEEGTTTTPFDLLVRNKVSRYDIVKTTVKHFDRKLGKKKVREIIDQMELKKKEHRAYIEEHGKDPEEVDGWIW